MYQYEVSYCRKVRAKKPRESSAVPRIGNMRYRPVRAMICPDPIEAIMRPRIIGSICRPLSVGVAPVTSCR